MCSELLPLLIIGFLSIGFLEEPLCLGRGMALQHFVQTVNGFMEMPALHVEQSYIDMSFRIFRIYF